jgi:hypothetical protein
MTNANEMTQVLLDQVASGQLSRRRFLTVASVAGLSAGFSGGAVQQALAAGENQAENQAKLEGANMPLTRTVHTSVSPEQMADRIAIRELLDAYAHCADRRDVVGQMSLFTADTEFLLFMDSRSTDPTQKISGREGLRPLFEDLKTYEATTHFNGQSTVVWGPESVSGVLNCLAYLVKVDGSRRTLTIISLRYLDHFVKLGGRWYFKQRKAMLDWSDSRPSTPGS